MAEFYARKGNKQIKIKHNQIKAFVQSGYTVFDETLSVVEQAEGEISRDTYQAVVDENNKLKFEIKLLQEENEALKKESKPKKGAKADETKEEDIL